jgi:Ricin-type beta-trefoil lectin domain-like
VTGVSTADGAYLQAFIAKHSGKCADVLGASQTNGGRVGQWTCTWASNQQWTVQAVS